MDINKTPRFLDASKPRLNKGRLAVIDVGSSMVRLVIYGSGIYPHLYLNQKTWTALAKGKSPNADFYLGSEAMSRTLSAIEWFLWVCKESQVERVVCTATSAVREAKNGQDFVDHVFEKTGLNVHIISGETEARLSAYAAVTSMAHAEGAVLDLGGGSLDICSTDTKGLFTSLPLGVLTLQAMSKNKPKKAVSLLEDALMSDVAFQQMTGDDLVAIGSGMRSIAALHMKEKKYPMEIMHGYVLDKEEAMRFCMRLVKGKISSKLVPHVADYIDVLPYRAAVLYAMLSSGSFKRVRFASFGLREGIYFHECRENIFEGDPLMLFAKDAAERDGRGEKYAKQLAGWVEQFFPSLPKRLLHVSAFFADIAWREQAAYRAVNAFEAVYGGSYVACTHKDRARLALMVYFSYEKELPSYMYHRLPPQIKEHHIKEAQLIGALFHLARYIDPGAKGLLERFNLTQNEAGLCVLNGPDAFMGMDSEAVTKRMDALNVAVKSFRQ